MVNQFSFNETAGNFFSAFIFVNKWKKFMLVFKFKKIENLNDYPLFLSNYLNSKSYRIPFLLKLSSSKLIAIVDQRVDSQLDAPYSTINQVIRKSHDQGKTWFEAKIIIHLEKTRESKTSAIDSVIVEDLRTKAIYLCVDIYPGGSGLMSLAKLLNPLGTADLGYTPDKKFRKFFQLNSDKKFILKSIEAKDWFQVFEIKDGDWKNIDESNLIACNVFVDNHFDSQTNLLHGSVYENIASVSEASQAKPVCSIFDGFKNNDPWYQKPKYYLESTAYLHLFKSSDEGDSWELIGDLNSLVKKENADINCLVLGPGQGLQLQHQKDGTKNGRIIFPFYEVNYALPIHAYFAFSDDVKNWKTSQYINPKQNTNWHWLSETQLVENHDGTLYAYMRNPEQNQICVSKSIDGGEVWTDLNNEIGFFTIKHIPLNSQIMHGLTNFYYQNQDYHLLSLPTIKDRKNGQLFLIDSQFFIQKICDLTSDRESFGYSALKVLEQTNQYLVLGILYETSETRNQGLSWVGFESSSTQDVQGASEILFKSIKLSFDN